MATPVEVVFIGLCSFLNINGTHSDMPPPSVILHNDSGHTPYIAYNIKDVVLTSTPTVTPSSHLLPPGEGAPHKHPLPSETSLRLRRLDCPALTLVQAPQVLAAEVGRGWTAEAETMDVLAHPIGTDFESHLDRANVARLDDHVRERERMVVVRVVDDPAFVDPDLPAAGAATHPRTAVRAGHVSAG